MRKFVRKYHYEKFRKMSRSDQEFYKKPATETVSFKTGFTDEPWVHWR